MKYEMSTGIAIIAPLAAISQPSTSLPNYISRSLLVLFFPSTILLYPSFIKPLIDRVAAFMGLLVTLPVTVPVTILLVIANRGSAFFIQKRPGKDERVFSIVKFKTMNDRRGKDGELLPDAERLTSVGKFIRKTSLDEIPQLLNVLAGQMSLIGPRPLLPQYLPLYNKFQRRRHEVKPGITGWAQVNGRNAISWDQKFEFDVWYVDNVSFALDMKILLMTVKKVFKSEGISQQGQATASYFTGSRERER